MGARKGTRGAPLRVVFDTNVVVSALLFRAGSLSWLRWVWSSAAAIPIVSRRTVDELIRVLSYPKFQLDSTEIQGLLAEFLPFAESVAVGISTAEAPQCRDPSDQIFLDVATAVRADALVTGDKDWLELEEDFPFLILTPAEFKLRLE